MSTGVALDLTQHLQPVHLGQLQVEEHQRGLIVGPLGELAAPIQVVQRLGAVSDVHDFVGELVRCERVENQFRVARAVLDEQNAFQCVHAVASDERGNAAVAGSSVK